MKRGWEGKQVSSFSMVIVLIFAFFLLLTACGGGGGGNGAPPTTGNGGGTFTASGTYTYNSGTGTLVFNTTSSDFTCNGPQGDLVNRCGNSI